MRDIRLLVSDIDGTLVHADKSLGPVTVDAARRLIAAGMPMTLISARPPSGMRWIAERIGLTGAMGAFNGGTIFAANGGIVSADRLDPTLAEALLALFEREVGMRWLFADGDWLSSKADDPHVPREILAAGVDPVLGADMRARIVRVDKLVAVSDDHDLLRRLEEQAKAIAGDRATIVRSQPYYLDVTASTGNKGDGITALARAFGVDIAHVAAIGDQYNDLAMFARAGFSIAMGQAPDDVKAKADEVTGAADDDGVAQAIDRLILPATASVVADVGKEAS